MTARTVRSLAALVAAGVGLLLALTLMGSVPSSAATAAGGGNCAQEQRNSQQAQSNERDAANARSVASRKYFQARDAQRANPSPANKRRAQRAYGDWQRAIQQHEAAKRTNQAFKRELRECQRR